jgi:predicted anti-sigma-YlaC factor YlaD
MSRDCSAIFALLSEYLDRELPEADCAELEQHIASCAPCVAFVDSLKKSVAMGQVYSPVAEPPTLAPETRQSLQDAYNQMLLKRGR